MAKLITEDFEFEFKFVAVEQWVCEEMFFTIKLTRKGQNIINKALLRKGTFYGYYDFCKDNDTECPLNDFKKALQEKKSIIWENIFEEDMCISIYPQKCFPYLDEKDDEYCTLIFSPNILSYKGSDCYGGYDGVSIILTPTMDEFAEFVAQLEKEYENLINE